MSWGGFGAGGWARLARWLSDARRELEGGAEEDDTESVELTWAAEDLDASARAWEKRLAADLGYKVALIVGDSTFSEIDLDGNAWWFRPVAKNMKTRSERCERRALRPRFIYCLLYTSPSPRDS